VTVSDTDAQCKRDADNRADQSIVSFSKSLPKWLAFGLMIGAVTALTEHSIMHYLGHIDTSFSFIDTILISITVTIISAMLFYFYGCQNHFPSEEAGLSYNSLLALGKGAVITDESGQIVFVNDEFERITGFSKEEAIGRTPSILNSGHQSKHFYRDMWESLVNEGSWRGDLWNKRKNGDLYHERLDIRKVNHFDGSGYFIGVFVDLSEQDELEQALLEAQRRELLVTFSGGIAHNFNNYLAAIEGNIFLAQGDKDLESVANHLEKAQQICRNAGALVKELMDLVKSNNDHSPEIQNISAAVNKAFGSAQAMLAGDIHLVANIPKLNGSIRCGHTDIDQIVLNLISNARDALEKTANGRIEVSLKVIEHEKNHSQVTCPRVKACAITTESSCLISVKDNGEGILEENYSNIFNPFFTTKDVDKGTGLGLVSIKQLVESNGGCIWFNSDVGIGTTFFVCLPLYK